MTGVRTYTGSVGRLVVAAGTDVDAREAADWVPTLLLHAVTGVCPVNALINVCKQSEQLQAAAREPSRASSYRQPLGSQAEWAATGSR